MNRGWLRANIAMAAVLLIPSLAYAAPERTPAEFYKGRNIFITVGYSPGGGYDLYARLLAQHWGRHIPGNPTVVPQNMPGAGSLKAALYIYTAAPKDGTAVGTFARGTGSAQLLGHTTVDMRKLTWLGSITKDTSLCVSWSKSPIKTWDDAMKTQFVVGGEGADSDPDIFAKLYKNLFGAKMRLASGFAGTSDTGLAMQRGEVQGMCGLSWSTIKSQHPNWIKDKSINLLIQAAPQRDPELPNVPMASDYAKTPEQRQILDFALVGQTMARPFAAPPGIPADRKAALLAAFDETMKDPAFIADAKRLSLDVNPVKAAEIDAMIAALYATPKDVIARAAKAMTN